MTKHQIVLGIIRKHFALTFVINLNIYEENVALIYFNKL